MIDGPLFEGLTFDDVLLQPGRSDVVPSEVSVKTNLTSTITLNIPVLSAAMDTVTESRMAIALAQQGGLGVIHKNMSIEDQAEEVDKVKRSESGMIVDPITVTPEKKIHEALDLMAKYRISGVPVITVTGKLVGILTNRDLRFETRLDIPVSEVMTSTNLITVPVGTTLQEAKDILHKYRVEKLLVVDDSFTLKGLITVKDIQKVTQYPLACKDQLGRLRVGAAVGTSSDTLDRALALARAKVDVLFVDTAHGHTTRVMTTIRMLKEKISDIPIIAGNIATAEAVDELAQLKVDGLKIGIGPGSICTTRIVSGAGVPQLTAIMECARAAQKYSLPVIADGGIKYSGDISKALAAGASSVMVGSLLAGTEESPGETVLYQGRTYRTYRGMGSIDAMKKGSADRYFQQEDGKLVPEGVEGRVPYRGTVAQMVVQMVGGLRSGMGYTGCRTIQELQQKARFIRITNAGLRESHVHDVIITKEAPNYRLE